MLLVLIVVAPSSLPASVVATCSEDLLRTKDSVGSLLRELLLLLLILV
jgi:hypothetical protein